MYGLFYFIYFYCSSYRHEKYKISCYNLELLFNLPASPLSLAKLLDKIAILATVFGSSRACIFTCSAAAKDD